MTESYGEMLSVKDYVNRAIRKVTQDLLYVSDEPDYARGEMSKKKLIEIKMKLKNIRDLIER